MTALMTEIDCPTARAIDVDGVSNESWRDAVWNAIAPVLGWGRLAGLEVLRHSLASRAGGAEYRVNVRVSFELR
jgi:flavin-binding protein dodecin